MGLIYDEPFPDAAAAATWPVSYTFLKVFTQIVDQTLEVWIRLRNPITTEKLLHLPPTVPVGRKQFPIFAS